MKVLIIGAGKIAFQYNYKHENIDTHYKALKNLGYQIDVFDVSEDNLSFIKNNFEDVNIINEINWHNYAIVSICSNTETHIYYLQKSIENSVPLVLCEKPISNNIEALNDFCSIIDKTESKIYVNYFRRFVPEFNDLKKQIQNKHIIHIDVKYQRGFINNASHAFDVLQFLLSDFQISNFSDVKLGNEEILNDKNLTFQCQLNDASLNLVALNNVEYNFFEVNIFAKDSVIKINNSGNTIEIYETTENNNVYKSNLELKYSKNNILRDYMKHVYEKIITNEPSNILESISLNLQLLKIKKAYE